MYTLVCFTSQIYVNVVIKCYAEDVSILRYCPYLSHGHLLVKNFIYEDTVQLSMCDCIITAGHQITVQWRCFMLIRRANFPNTGMLN